MQVKNKIIDDLIDRGLFAYSLHNNNIRYVVVLSLINNILTVLTPFFLIFIMTKIWFLYDTYTYTELGVFFVLMGGVWYITGHLKDNIMYDYIVKHATKMSLEIMNLIKQLPYSYTANFPVESQFDRYMPLYNLSFIWFNRVFKSLLDIPLVVFCFFIITFLLGFVYFACLTLVLIVICVLLFLRGKVTAENNKIDTVFRGYLRDFVINLKQIKKYDKNNLFKEKIDDIALQKILNQNSTEQQKTSYDNFIEMILMIFYVCTLGISVYYVISGSVEPGYLFVILLMSWYSIAPLKQLTELPNNWRISQDVFGQLRILKKSITPVTRHSNIKMPLDMTFDIEFKNVSHQFPNSSEFMLGNISFLAKKREVMLFNGVSGSGKSTILNLIMGLESPSSGIIKVGYNVNVLDKKSLRENIVYVNNLSFFESLSLYENIELLYPDYNEHEIIKLLVNSQMISSLEYKKYKNMKIVDIQEDDRVTASSIINKIVLLNLMADYKNKIIILDEPIIEGDKKEYAFLANRISQLSNDNTILIASRYNYYQAISDRIMVLDNGRVKKYFGRSMSDE